MIFPRGNDKRMASTPGVVDAKSPCASLVFAYDARGLWGRLENTTLTFLELIWYYELPTVHTIVAKYEYYHRITCRNAHTNG